MTITIATPATIMDGSVIFLENHIISEHTKHFKIFLLIIFFDQINKLLSVDFDNSAEFSASSRGGMR